MTGPGDTASICRKWQLQPIHRLNLSPLNYSPTMEGLLAEINAKKRSLEAGPSSGEASKRYKTRGELEAEQEEEERRKKTEADERRERLKAESRAVKMRKEVSYAWTCCGDIKI